MVPAMNLVALFLDAIRKDYIHVVIPLLSTNPGLLDEAERATEGNTPLLIMACELGSLHVAAELGRRKPELVSAKNHNGYTAMHLASFKGCAREIKLLAELNSEVCLVEDNQFMIPLHIASMRGYDEAIRVLVEACPQSLRRLTPQYETALHLALKSEHWAAFQVLFQEATKLQLEHLLNRKDHEGNTLLHISTSKMSIRAVKLLLPDNYPSPRVLSVNSMNNNGQTALDVYYQNPYNVTPREIQIGRILREAGATEGRFLRTPEQQPEASRRALTQQCPQSFRRRLLPWPWQLETRNVIIVVLVMIVGTAFTVICNLPRGLDEEKATKTTFYFIGVISGQLPTIFYLMLFNTVGVFSSILIIGILVWSLPLGAVLLLVVIITLIVYVLIMDKILPKFDVKIGSSNISSSRFVWLSAVTFIFSGALVYTASKYMFWRIKSKSGTIDHIHMEQV